MAREWTAADLDDLVRLYAEGVGVVALAARYGCRKPAINAALASRGVEKRTVSDNRRLDWTRRDDHFPLDDATLIHRYVDLGESTVTIGQSIDRTAASVGQRLRRLGYERNRSEAGVVRAARLGHEGRMALIASAHAAVRGRAKSADWLHAIAVSRQRSGGVPSGYTELLMEDWLRERGLDPVPQMAIDRYNVDLAIPPVAVEIVFRTAADLRTPRFVRKVENLTDRGLHVLVVLVSRRTLIQPGAADHAVAFLKEAQADPSPVGQYRVVWGSGEVLAAGRGDFAEWAAVPPPRNGKYPRR